MFSQCYKIALLLIMILNTAVCSFLTQKKISLIDDLNQKKPQMEPKKNALFFSNRAFLCQFMS